MLLHLDLLVRFRTAIAILIDAFTPLGPLRIGLKLGNFVRCVAGVMELFGCRGVVWRVVGEGRAALFVLDEANGLAFGYLVRFRVVVVD